MVHARHAATVFDQSLCVGELGTFRLERGSSHLPGSSVDASWPLEPRRQRHRAGAAADSPPARFLRYHAAVEGAILESGIAYTFLRLNVYMQGLLSFRAAIARDGKFFAAASDGKVSVLDVRDIAAATAVALTEPGHEGGTYDLASSFVDSRYPGNLGYADVLSLS